MHTRIKQLRETLGLTQAEFAKNIGKAQVTITSYENQRRVPTNACIKLICNVYNVNETWLRTGEGELFGDGGVTITPLQPITPFQEQAVQMAVGDTPYLQELTMLLWSLDETELKAIREVVRKIKASPNL